MAEEFALQERARNRSAIHHDERPLAPAAQLMNGASHQFLAGTRFALNENGRVRRGHYLDVPENLSERRAFADHVSNVLIGPNVVARARS